MSVIAYLPSPMPAPLLCQGLPSYRQPIGASQYFGNPAASASPASNHAPQSHRTLSGLMRAVALFSVSALSACGSDKTKPQPQTESVQPVVAAEEPSSEKADKTPPPGWSAEPESFYTDEYAAEHLAKIEQFCREKKVDLAAARSLSEQMHPDTTQARHNALLVAAFVLWLQQGGKDSFYQAKSSDGQQENKRFIDTVVAKIRDGKLTVRNKKETNDNTTAGYNLVENQLLLHAPDISFIDTRMTLVHELFHFYQDIQAPPEAILKIKELELPAYQKAGEFALYDLGIVKARSHEKAFEQHIAGIMDLMIVRAMTLAYYKWKNDPAADIAAQELEDALNNQYLLGLHIGLCWSTLDVIENAIADMTNELNAQRADKIERSYLDQLIEAEQKLWEQSQRDLILLLESDTEQRKFQQQRFVKQFADIITELQASGAALIVAKRYKTQLQEHPGQLTFAFHSNDPDILELWEPILRLRPYSYLYSIQDGVE